MKLDFESNASSISTIDEEFCNDIYEDIHAKASAQLQAGIKAAQEGSRAEAKHLLLRVTETEPGNEEAWMWLASVSEYPEELLGFLGHVLQINPHNERALEWTKSTKNLLSQSFVQRGTEASKASQKDFARQCFRQAIAQDAENETAWVWLASVSDSAEEKITHLQKALTLNPENDNAKFMLKALKNQRTDGVLQKAVWSAVAGELEAAKHQLEEILRNTPELVEGWVLKSFLVDSFEEKIDCFEKILDLDDENELANLNWTALLDIMAKAEAKPDLIQSEATSPSAKYNFEEPKTAVDLTKTKENMPYNVVSPGEDLDARQSNIEFKGKESFEPTETPENLRSGAETEEYHVVSLTDTLNEKSRVSEDAAQNYVDYSQYASSEISIPHETLPSYYESQENVFKPLEASGESYPSESEEIEQKVFSEDFGEAKENSSYSERKVSAENTTGEKSFNETVLVQKTLKESPHETLACPFCNAEGEAESLICNSCHTMLTLSDLETLLAHPDADREILRQAIERMKDERDRRDFSLEDIKLLAVGYINLKNFRQGCVYLNEAAQMNPNDVVLSSKVNSLKIRLAEIEDQQSVQETMLKNRKILVVDDSATVRKLISSKLEKSGHEVFCAVDGIDALEKIKEIVPDLILLDINMPRMDGYQVCKLIRSNEETKDVPVVMISGKDGFFDKVRGRMAGSTGYITKPFGPETLMKMVETYIVTEMVVEK